MKVYIYVGKSGEWLLDSHYAKDQYDKLVFPNGLSTNDDRFGLCERKFIKDGGGSFDIFSNCHMTLNGTIPACFDLSIVEDLSDEYSKCHTSAHFDYLLEAGGISKGFLERYCPVGSGKRLFAWHIDEGLNVLGQTLSLRNFLHICKNQICPGCSHEWQSYSESEEEFARMQGSLEGTSFESICTWIFDAAPQSWCFAIDPDDRPCIILSVQPEWACPILNKHKTIEFRHTNPLASKRLPKFEKYQ